MAMQPIKRYAAFTPDSVDTSEVARMQSLAGMGQAGVTAFSAIGEKLATAEAPEQALQDVEKAKEEGEELKKRNPLAWGASTYNATLEKAYVDSKELDFAAQAARIATENPTDVMAFDSLIREQAQATLSNVQPEFEAQVRRRVDLITANTSAKIYEQQVARNMEEANALSIANIESAEGDMLRSANEGDVDAAQGMYQDILVMLDTRVANGQELEGTVMTQKQELTAALQGELARSVLKNTYKSEGAIAAAAWIQKVDDNPAKDFTVEQQDALVSILKADLTETLNIAEIGQQQAAADLKADQKQNASNLLAGIFDGDVGIDTLAFSAKSSGIDFSQFTTLSNVLTTRGQGIDDVTLINEIQNIMLTDPDKAEQMIMLNANTRIETATAGQMLKSVRDARSSESVLQTSEAKRFREYVEDQITVTGAFGAIDPEQAQKRANIVLVFDERVLNGEDPRAVAKDLMEVSTEIKEAVSPAYEQDEMAKLDKEAAETNMSASVYNQRVQQIREKAQGSENYRAYKDYLNELMKGE